MTLTARLSSAAEIERDSANSNSNFAGRLRLALVYLGEKIRLVRPHWIPLGIIILAGLVVLTWFRGFMLYHWDTVFPFNPSAAMKAFFWPWSDLISTGTPVLGSVSLPYFLLIYVAQDVLGLSSLDSQILLYYSLLTLAGVSMYTFFTAQVRNERKPPSISRKRVQSIRFVAVSSLSLLLIHIWWIYPTAIFYGSQLTRAGGSSFGAVGLSDLMSNSAHTDYFNLIRLAGMFPLYNSDRYPHYSFAWMYQTLSPIMLVSLMTPIIAFLALILKGTKLPRMIQLFAATCVLGVIPVAAGTQPPFGGLFEWLALNIPSFSILFRDPYQKFGFWIPFGYSLLIGSCFLTVVGRKKGESEANPNPDVKTGQHRSLRRVAVLGIILTLVTTGLVWPMFTGDVIPTESPVLPSPRVQVPGYYYDATSWLLSQKGSFRILSLPEDQILQSSNWSHGYAASDILRYLTGDSIISTSPQVSDLNVFQHNLYSYIYGGGANLTKILKTLDVRFIVLRMDAGFYPTVTQQVNLTQLRIYLDNQNGLDLSREFGPLLFFEARDYGPKVSVAGEALTLSQLNRVGLSIHDYSEGWQKTSLNMSASNSELSFAFDPHGTYSYRYATTSEPLNLSIQDFSYLKVQFSSSSNG